MPVLNIGDPLQDGDLVIRRVTEDPDQWECSRVGPGWESKGLVGVGFGPNSWTDAWNAFWRMVSQRRENAAAALKAAAKAAKEDTSPEDLRVTVAKKVADRAKRNTRQLLWVCGFLLSALIFAVIFR